MQYISVERWHTIGCVSIVLNDRILANALKIGLNFSCFDASDFNQMHQISEFCFRNIESQYSEILIRKQKQLIYIGIWEW